MNDIKNVINIVFSPKYWEFRQNDQQSHTLTISGMFLAFISMCLTALNILKHYWFMTGTTTILIIGFIFVTLLAKRKKIVASSIVMILMVSLVFSIYAVTGQNYGFAILWILLVPILALNLVSIEFGTILSVYFQIFLCVIFYTPLKELVGNGNYNDTFIMRFPLLYLCSFGGTFILAVNREYNSVIRTVQSFTDALTGLYNRAKYSIMLDSRDEDEEAVHVVAFDLNGLKRANDSFGHEAGDKLIKLAAEVITETFAKKGMCFRLGGDEFAVIMHSTGEELDKIMDDFRTNVARSNAQNELQVKLSVGVSSSDVENTRDLKILAKLADGKMYEDKAAYYSKHENERRIR